VREIFFYKWAYGKKIIKRPNLTCDKAFFLKQQGEGEKKRTPDTITSRVVCP